MINEIEKLLIELISKRLEYPGRLISDTMQNAVRTEYASDTYSYLEGYYSPSHFEIICSNLKRGKLLIRPRKEHTGFKYFFDEKDELVLISKTTRGITDYVILYEKHDDLNVGYLYYVSDGNITVGKELNRIILTEAKTNLTTMYSVTSIRPEVVQEDLYALDNLIITSELHEYHYEGEKVVEFIKHYRVYSCKENKLKMNIVHEHNLITGEVAQHNREE